MEKMSALEELEACQRTCQCVIVDLSAAWAVACLYEGDTSERELRWNGSGVGERV